MVHSFRPVHGAALLALAASTAAALPARAVPLFQQLPDPFGSPQPCGPGQKEGCFTNYLRITDIDGDGDLDVLFPSADGYFQKGVPQPFLVYENDGNAGFTDISATAVGGFVGYLRQIAVQDINGDGLPDIYGASAWGDPDVFFINKGGGVFSDEAASRLPGVSSRAGAVRFADVDSDGDADLLIANGWVNDASFAIRLYLNDGAGSFSEASDNLPTTKVGTQPIDFDLIDIDGDFDLDLLINMHQGRSSLWRNDGGGVFIDITENIPSQPGLHYGPAVCDVDGDGDLDIWTDNSGPNYTEQLLINDGAGAFTDETAARVGSQNVSGADDNGVVCVDIDGDGDFDAIIMSLNNVERVLVNDGTGHFTAMFDAFPQITDGTLWMDVGDLNGDGRLDVVTGQGESGQNWRNRVYLGNQSVPVDTFPPRFRAVEALASVAAGAQAVVRFAVTDEAVTDEGPRLRRAFVRVTTQGSPSEVDATFMGGDLFRAALGSFAEGAAVSYSACAVDLRGNEGCAEVKSFTVGAPSGAGGGGAGGDGGSGGEGGNAAGPNISEGDCGCATPGQGGRDGVALAAGILIAALARRRRGRWSRG